MALNKTHYATGQGQGMSGDTQTQNRKQLRHIHETGSNFSGHQACRDIRLSYH